MEFTRKNKILLLVLLVILNAIIRIPLVPHELGLDSFSIHLYADSITEYGEILWIRHLIHLFGFGETPPALPVLISGFSQCLGISSELSILLLSFLSGIFGAIAAYVFIYYVTKDDSISYLAALLFSLSPEFLRLTNTNKRLSYIVLLFSVYALLMATHHMGVLLLFYLFPLFMLLSFKIFGKIKFVELNAKIITLIWISSFLSLFLPLVLKLGFYKDHAFLWSYYLYGKFFKGDELHIVPLNMIVDYVGKMGILLPFVIVGVIVLLSKTGRRTTFDSYVLIFLLFVTPILAVSVYTPMLILIIVTFLISVGLIRFMDIKVVRKKVKVLLPAFLVVMLCFSMFMLVNWGSWTGETVQEKYNEQAKNTGMFIKNFGGNGTLTANDRTYIHRFSVYSGMVSPPTNLYKYCFMERKKIKAKLNTDIMSIFKGRGKNIILFEKEGNESLIDPWHEYAYIWVSDLDGDRILLDKYNIKYCIETNFGTPIEYYVKKLKLFEKAHESRPKIYDNKIEEIYFIG
jgi:hypothetical protein